MAELNRRQLHELARLGARARLEELRREETSIRRAFPDLFRRGSDTGKTVDRRSIRRRPRMSAAARKAVSERMKRYWAKRRKTKASK